MIHITLSKTADLMVWGTVPLWGILGFWEHHLALTEPDHTLVQLVLLVLVFGWAFAWNSIGEHDRLAHYASWVEGDKKFYPGAAGIQVQGGTTLMPGNNVRHNVTMKEVSIQIEEGYHVSNN